MKRYAYVKIDVVTIAESGATRASGGIKAKTSAAMALTAAAFHIFGVASRSWVMPQVVAKAQSTP